MKTNQRIDCTTYNVEDVYPITTRHLGCDRQQGTYHMLSSGRAIWIDIIGPLQKSFEKYTQIIHVDQIVQHDGKEVEVPEVPFYPLDFTLTKEETTEMSREFVSGTLRNTITSYSVVYHMLAALAQLWIRERDFAVNKFMEENPNTNYEVILHLAPPDHLDFVKSLGESVYGWLYLSEDESIIQMETSFKFEVIAKGE